MGHYYGVGPIRGLGDVPALPGTLQKPTLGRRLGPGAAAALARADLAKKLGTASTKIETGVMTKLHYANSAKECRPGWGFVSAGRSSHCAPPVSQQPGGQATAQTPMPLPEQVPEQLRDRVKSNLPVAEKKSLAWWIIPAVAVKLFLL